MAFTGIGAAGASPYRGKTKGGTAITFNLVGSKLKNIRTMVPTICVETTGGYSSRAGAELFQPRKATLGRKVKSKALQPSAMNHATKVTKNYTVEAHRSGRRIKGKLSLSFSFVILDLYGAKILICNGTTGFTAKPR
ncbi:MAG: hypothetical protein M9938_10845 [Solirubrobacterales bacterium]|nr:hypothetical protein [Solirubrobacterales bacterium]